MKRLTDLLQNVNFTTSHPVDECVSSITTDSRKVKPGGLFIAVKGMTVDGHQFIRDAHARGCVAVVVDQEPDCDGEDSSQSPNYIRVADSRKALGGIAAAFYGYPADELTLIGITGTNGKTTITYLLESILIETGANPGVIGTINYRFNGKEEQASFTTPESIELQRLMRKMADGGVTHVVMEASSHALALDRLQGLKFDAALFTNLTRDHLDFHSSMEDYFEAKKLLFTHYLKEGGSAVVCHDSGYTEEYEEENHVGQLTIGKEIDWSDRLSKSIREYFKEASPEKRPVVVSCGLKKTFDIHAGDYKLSVNGTKALLNISGKEQALRTSLVGWFNVKNILAAAGVASSMGIDIQAIAQGVSRVTCVPGRLEKVWLTEKVVNHGLPCPEPLFSVYVDYAHTPDALENVLKNLRKLTPQSLIVVFGCGGDRDQGKRFLMGEVAGYLADVVIITSDNSRSEPTEQIIAEIQRGTESTGQTGLRTENVRNGERWKGFLVIPSRSEAIETAIRSARQGDIVLISGKGHETCQVTREGSIFFDDRIEARTYLARYCGKETLKHEC